MAKTTSQNLLTLSLLVILPIITTSKCLYDCDGGAQRNKIQGMFIFGSSLVDNGNNNYLNTTAKCNYSPYGVDFPLGPSGRWTNGRNVIDLFGEYLGLPGYIPTFENPSTNKTKIVHGVSFSSGGSGILDDTGSIFGEVISLSKQINNFKEGTLPELEKQLGCESCESLPNYIFVFGVGGNDYTLNYFPNVIKGRNATSLESFTSDLIERLSQQIKGLYKLGARKFILMALYPLGCIPSIVKITKPIQMGMKCNVALESAALLFNSLLKKLVDGSQSDMPGADLVIVNAHKVIRDILDHPESNSFKDTSNSCCEVVSMQDGGNGVSCTRGGKVCADRDNYVYFDGLHPTEAVNKVIAEKGYFSMLKTEAYPFNIKQLAQL